MNDPDHLRYIETVAGTLAEPLSDGEMCWECLARPATGWWAFGDGLHEVLGYGGPEEIACDEQVTYAAICSECIVALAHGRRGERIGTTIVESVIDAGQADGAVASSAQKPGQDPGPTEKGDRMQIELKRSERDTLLRALKKYEQSIRRSRSWRPSEKAMALTSVQRIGEKLTAVDFEEA